MDRVAAFDPRRGRISWETEARTAPPKVPASRVEGLATFSCNINI